MFQKIFGHIDMTVHCSKMQTVLETKVGHVNGVWTSFQQRADTGKIAIPVEEENHELEVVRDYDVVIMSGPAWSGLNSKVV